MLGKQQKLVAWALGATLTVAAFVALGTYESYDTPNVPVPKLAAHWLDGRKFQLSALAGKPWVVNLWVPG